MKSLEADPRFAEKQLGREKRKAAATKAVETKTARLLEWVKGLEIVIPSHPVRSLILEAIRHYNDFRPDIDFDYQTASLSNDPEFLKRITFNYIRHELTDYEEQLDSLFGKVGTENGYLPP